MTDLQYDGIKSMKCVENRENECELVQMSVCGANHTFMSGLNTFIEVSYSFEHIRFALKLCTILILQTHITLRKLVIMIKLKGVIYIVSRKFTTKLSVQLRWCSFALTSPVVAGSSSLQLQTSSPVSLFAQVSSSTCAEVSLFGRWHRRPLRHSQHFETLAAVASKVAEDESFGVSAVEYCVLVLADVVFVDFEIEFASICFRVDVVDLKNHQNFQSLARRPIKTHKCNSNAFVSQL